MIADYWRAVEDLTGRGFEIFPCQPNGKRPLIAGGGGCRGATADEDVLATWSELYGGCNFGVATGVKSNLVVVDVDVKNEAGGEQSIARLEAEGKVFKPTLEAATPSGGRHLYYRFAPGITNSASLVAPGIDIRGEGGYVLAAPSTIAGAAYAWINDLPVARLPMWLEMTLKPSPKCRPKPFVPSGDTSIAGLLDTVVRAREPGRNNILFWATMVMHEDGKATMQNKALMTEAALGTGLNQREIDGVFNSVERRSQGAID